MIALAPQDRRHLERLVRAKGLLESHRIARPSDFYRPHEKGQRQFHEAERPMRLLFPGNAWGKTTAIAIECDAWIQRSQRWRPTPERRITCIWFCPDFKQFDIIRPQIEEECLTRGWRFTSTDNKYTWPDGGRLFLASADRKWTFLQGINPDLIVFDEQPPLKVWREMLMRRRGRRKTEFCIAATATQGITWMATLYEQWADFHTDAGMDEMRAMLEQRHPEVWCWPRGGVHDNPGMDASDVAWYEGRTWSSDKEKKVRLYGGFENWAGDPVFDEAAVEWMRAQAALLDGEMGHGRLVDLEPLWKGDPRLKGRITISL